MRPRDSRLQGVVYGFAGMRSLASVPIIHDEGLAKIRHVSGFGVKSNATIWSVSTSFKFGFVHRLDSSSSAV